MKIKKLAIGLGLIISNSISSYGQDYFIVKKDTTFCSKLNYSKTSQGFLKSISYTDVNGKEVLIEGRKNVPNVETFYRNSVCFDEIPLKAHKPKGYLRYTKRAVDGKLKVYLDQQKYDPGTQVYRPNSNSGFNHNGWESSGGPIGIYRFYLKMPDGTYYKINSKRNMKRVIKPYLLKCAEFKSQYKGDFSTGEESFMEMIKLYNSLCD